MKLNPVFVDDEPPFYDYDHPVESLSFDSRREPYDLWIVESFDPDTKRSAAAWCTRKRFGDWAKVYSAKASDGPSTTWQALTRGLLSALQFLPPSAAVTAICSNRAVGTVLRRLAADWDDPAGLLRADGQDLEALDIWKAIRSTGIDNALLIPRVRPFVDIAEDRAVREKLTKLARAALGKS